MMNLWRKGVSILGLCGLLACSTEIDINAPAQEIWAVYGVLRAQDSVQYIRVSTGFLPEDDATVYARENDLSAKGLTVRLRQGNQVLEAIQVDSVAKDPPEGNFFPSTTLYRLSTQGFTKLKAGMRYQLEITRPDDPDFMLQSETTIPDAVDFAGTATIPGGGQTRCLRQASLEGEYKIDFSRGNASAFEIRAILQYEEEGQPKTAVYGPTDIFEDDFRCNDSESSVCYKFREKEILRSLFDQIDPEPNRRYTYGVTDQSRCNPNEDELPKAFELEVTSLDAFLATYQSVNDPKFTDFNTVRREYSNITGSNIVVGVFGSINTSRRNFQLSPCSAFLLQLNDIQAPQTPCAF